MPKYNQLGGSGRSRGRVSGLAEGLCFFRPVTIVGWPPSRRLGFADVGEVGGGVGEKQGS